MSYSGIILGMNINEGRPLSPRFVPLLEVNAATALETTLREKMAGKPFNKALEAFINNQGGAEEVAKRMFVITPDDLMGYVSGTHIPFDTTIRRIVRTAGLKPTSSTANELLLRAYLARSQRIMRRSLA